MVVETNGLKEFIYMMSVISVSLGITNLLPFPPLDRRKNFSTPNRSNPQKPLKQTTELKIQMAGFVLLIGLSIFVTYNDIMKFF